MNNLYGVHWFTEGDVKFVVGAGNIRGAVDQFLTAEYKLITDVEPDKTLEHEIVYGLEHAEVTIHVGKEYDVCGKVGLVNLPQIPVLLQDFVPTSLRNVAVTYSSTESSDGGVVRVILVDRPSKEEQIAHPLNLNNQPVSD